MPAGITVAEGGGDAFVVMVGQSAEPLYGKGFFGLYKDAVVPGQYTVEGGQTSTGSIVKWFKDHFAKDSTEEVARRGVDVYEVLNERAAKVSPGSECLVVLDYWQGNRTPYTDSEARGMIWGLTLHHGEEHVFRAILEGICYGTEHILWTMRDNNFEPNMGVVCGGATKSELWMKLHTDISNPPIHFTKVSEAPALGSAILGAVGAGAYPDVQTAANEMVHVERSLEPDPEQHEEYQFYVDKYVETYSQMRELVHEVTRHEAIRGAGEKAGA